MADPAVWITGTGPDKQLNFRLPTGGKGDKGDPGAKGADGSNVLPTNDAVAQAITTEGPAKTALSATIATEIEAPIEAAVAPIAARPMVTARVPARSVSDSIVHVRQGSANAVMLRQTDMSRQVAIIQNLGANDMMVAEGTNGSLAAPGSGYVTVTAGQEYVTASTRPVFAYMSTTAATARVYCAQGV